MHSHSHTNDKKDNNQLKIAFILNFIFTIIELIGGYFTNSVAIFSDAIHDLGDSVAIGSALWFEKVALRGRDEKYSYGYKRYSTLGALITSVILIVGSFVVLYESIPRLFDPQEVKATGMIWMSVLGIIFNGIAVLRLHDGAKSLNNKAVMLHLLEDVLGWFVVLVGSIIIRYTNWFWIDSLLSMFVACFILYNVFGNIRKIFSVFLQTTPDDLDVIKLKNELLIIDGVIDVHDIHSWSMDGDYNIMSLHIVVKEDVGREHIIRLRKEASAIIRRFSINHSTIAVEYENEICEGCK